MRTGSRLARAAGVSPLMIVPTVIAAYVALNFKDFVLIFFLQTEPAWFFGEMLEMTIWLSLFGVILGWFGTFMIGIPVYVLLRHFGMAQPVPCALLGAIFGLLFGSMILPEVDYSLMIMACGASVAGKFAGIANCQSEPADSYAPGEWY